MEEGKPEEAFLVRGLLGAVGGVALLNYAITKRLEGKGRYPWQNEDGKGLGELFLGKDEYKHNSYIQDEQNIFRTYKACYGSGGSSSEGTPGASS